MKISPLNGQVMTMAKLVPLRDALPPDERIAWDVVGVLISRGLVTGNEEPLIADLMLEVSGLVNKELVEVFKRQVHLSETVLIMQNTIRCLRGEES